MKRIKKALALGTSAVTLIGLGGLANAEVMEDGDVDGLVDAMSENVDDIEIVTGEEAHIEDGRQAARIASVLVNQNYEEAAEEDFIVDAEAEVTEDITEPTVTIEKVSDVAAPLRPVGYEITDSTYTIEHWNDEDENDDFNTYKNSTTLKHAQVPEILDRQTIEIEVDDDDQKYTLEEEIEITDHSAAYGEDDDAEEGYEHGLFYGTEKGNFEWTFNFDVRGQGLPTNSSKYTNSMPEFEMLGQDFVLSKSALDDGEIEFWEAAETVNNLGIGDPVEMDGWTVTLLGVQTDPRRAQVQVEYGDDVVTETIDLDEGEEMLGMTVYVEEVEQWLQDGEERSSADLLLGTETLDLEEEGEPFGLDERWELVGYETATGDVGSDGDTLDSITLSYGYDDAGDGEWLEYGDFDATPPEDDSGGLPANVAVPGPLDTFELEFLGMGESSPVDTTQVDVDLSQEEIVNVEWIDRSGTLNIFDPSDVDDAVLEVNETADVGDWTNTSVIQMEEDQYTVIGNKVVFLEDIDEDDDVIEVEFRINSEDGVSLIEEFEVNETANFFLDQGGDTVDFNVTAEDDDYVYINANETGDFVVDTGDRVLMDNPGTVGLAADNGNLEDVHYTNETISKLFVADHQGAEAYVFYNESDDDAGIKIGDDYQEGTYINYEQSSGDVEVEDEQHILGTGLEITDTDRQAASFILPEDYRNALTRIGTTVENDDIPDDGMEVGDSVTIGYDDVPAEFNGYEVTSIDWNIDFEVEDVVGTVENYEDFYTAKSYLGNDDPAEMIMDDTEPGVAQYRIVVGGPYVNALAEQFDTADDLQEAGDSVIAAEDNDLLVAGYLKEDTVDAADDLINRLTG